MFKQKSGITLIALVITIIVLLILAGVAISMITGGDGIFSKAKQSAEIYNREAGLEELNMKISVIAMEKYGEGKYENLTLQEIADGLADDEQTEYLKPGKAIATTEKIDVTGYSSILVKLKAYPFEYEITENANISAHEVKKEVPAEVGESSHEATSLTYSWEEINELAKQISLNYEREPETGTTRITEDTEEVKMGDYTIGVGDTIQVGPYTARVLGFNQDLLAESVKNPYGDDKPHRRAGISFEFVSFLMNAQMNSSNTTSGGWGACALRGTLNNTTINTLANKSYIKLVTKTYANGSTTTTTCEDKLWLLACSEISNSPSSIYVSGMSRVYESNCRYKYYAKGNIGWSSASNLSKKPSVSSPAEWWLRSFYAAANTPSFCTVWEDGSANYFSPSSYTRGVAPGFCI